MRIAVITDIHGNLGALDAVLADVTTREVDMTVNLGDILSGPLQPRETAERLMALGYPTLAGNHERQILTQPEGQMSLSDRYASSQLTQQQRSWLGDLPKTLILNDVLLCHGDPSSDVSYFLENIESGRCYAATADEIEVRAGPKISTLILCGHTHIPRVAQLRDGRMVVNPGSVGLPAYSDDNPVEHCVETGSPHARYAIVERRKDSWIADLISVPYDHEAAAAIAHSRGREDWAKALRTGRV